MFSIQQNRTEQIMPMVMADGHNGSYGSVGKPHTFHVRMDILADGFDG
jgi:hypothetical protein